MIFIAKRKRMLQLCGMLSASIKKKEITAIVFFDTLVSMSGRMPLGFQYLKTSQIQTYPSNSNILEQLSMI